MPQQSDSSPIHWSKDFVEHLRTVHFSLIGIATGLILIVVSAKPYNPATALREIHQILELKKLWSPEWIMNRASEGPVTFVEDHHERQEPLSLRSMNAVTAATVATHDFFNGKEVDFNLPELHFEPNTQLLKPFPSTLMAFEGWWYDMFRGYDLYIPSALCEDGQYKSSDDSAPLTRSGRLKILQTFHMKEEDKLRSRVDLILRVSPPIRGLNDPKLFDYEGIDRRQGLIYILPVCAVQSMNIRQRNIVAYFDWDEKPYPDAFADLAQATAEIRTLELEDVEKLLSDEASKGNEIFEAFGMKFPAAQITTWGIVILLGVQLYLVVYLKQLSGKLRPSDPAWDVPWLGMDTSMLAQGIFGFSVVVLPLIAVLTLSVHWVNRKPLYWNRWTAFQIALLIAAFSLSCVMAASSWKFRPKLQDVSGELSEATPTFED
jgi:hypothetical protein